MTGMSSERFDVGVIVGRFQVHELHEGHRALIDSVRENHDKTLVFIGLSPIRNTIANPLDYAARAAMFRETYPDVEVGYIEDAESDEVWSSNLDKQIERMTNPHQTIALYGGRDGFVEHYTTKKYPTFQVEPNVMVSGTEIRRRVANSSKPTVEYRAGVIAASFNRFPTCFTTVDIAVYDVEKDMVLVGQKSNEKKYRFIGGFSSPDSNSFEEDAVRELREETGFIVDSEHLDYIGTTKINDWRYRNETDCVKTIFFAVCASDGDASNLCAGDDIANIKWIPVEGLEDQILPDHQDLVEMFMNHVDSNGRGY